MDSTVLYLGKGNKGFFPPLLPDDIQLWHSGEAYVFKESCELCRGSAATGKVFHSGQGKGDVPDENG